VVIISNEKIQKSLKDIIAIKQRMSKLSTKLFELEKRLIATEALAMRNLKHPLSKK